MQKSRFLHRPQTLWTISIVSFQSPARSRPPAINLPPLTLYLLVAMLAVYAVGSLAPAHVERWIIVHFSFIPAAWSEFGWPLWAKIVAPVTYAFLHGGFLHLVLNGVMLAVMGQVLERRLGQPKFLLVFLAGAVGGALVHALIGGAPRVPLVGASAGVGALYGAGIVMHARGIYLGPNSRILVALTAFFLITNLIGLVLPLLGNVAYAAHLGGFIAGALITTCLIQPTRAQRF